MQRGAPLRERPSEKKQEAPGLRERKAAHTRLAIAESLHRRLASADLGDISADDLAADANVSRVTFFNYFPAKRDAVDFVLAIQFFRFQVDIHERGLRGMAAVDHIFATVGDDLAVAPERMRRLYAECFARPTAAAIPQLALAERMQLAPELDQDAVEPVALGSLFMRLVAEARADGVALIGSDYEVSHFLGSVMHGATMIGRSKDDSDWSQLFRRHARRALGLLGADGWSDPRPPRTPERYRRAGPRRGRKVQRGSQRAAARKRRKE